MKAYIKVEARTAGVNIEEYFFGVMGANSKNAYSVKNDTIIIKDYKKTGLDIPLQVINNIFDIKSISFDSSNVESKQDFQIEYSDKVIPFENKLKNTNQLDQETLKILDALVDVQNAIIFSMEKNVSEEKIVDFLKGTSREIKNMNRTRLNLKPGTIVTCDFAGGLKGEINNKCHAIVIAKTLVPSTYLIVPIGYVEKEGFCKTFEMKIPKESVKWNNQNENHNNVVAYLNRVTEVSESRLFGAEGCVNVNVLVKILKMYNKTFMKKLYNYFGPVVYSSERNKRR